LGLLQRPAESKVLEPFAARDSATIRNTAQGCSRRDFREGTRILRPGFTNGRRGLAACVASLAALATVLAVATSASAAGPLIWSTPQPVAQEPPFSEPNFSSDISCLSSSVCFVLADANADTTEAQLISTSNADGVTPTWSTPATIAPGYGVDSLSCPTVDFCAGSGSQGAHGYFFTTDDPGATAPDWTITTAPNATDYFVALSCPTTGLCVAGDRDGKAWITTDPTDANPTWTGPMNVGINGITTQLTSLSCAGTTLCVFGDSAGETIRSTNPASASPTWRSPQSLASEPIQDVSCPTTGLCAALDESHDVFVSTDPIGASPVWNESADVLNPPGFTISSSISCPSASLCAVVDVGGNVAVTTDPTAADPVWHTSSIPGSGLHPYLACPSASECVAVDQTNDGARAARTLDPAVTSPSWNTQTIDPGGRVRLEGISCAETALCAILDDKGEISISTDPDSATPTWSTPVEPSPNFIGVGEISCPSVDLCVATGYDGGFVESTDPSAASPTWASQSGIDINTILRISCSSSTLCVAFDEAGHTVTSTNPGAPTPSWTKSAASVDPNATVESISCPSDSLCVIGDSDGNVLVSHNPGGVSPTWTNPANVSPNGFITNLSCQGQMCIALDGWANFGSENGLEMVHTANAGADTPTWKTSLIPDPDPFATPVTDLSCATASLCYAATGGGDVLTTTNPGGTRPVWSAPLNVSPARINTLDCTSAVLCGALTRTQALIGVPPANPQHTISLVEAGPASSVVSSPTGIDCPTNCAQAFDDGTSVTLTAAPHTLFTGWSGGGCSGTGTCQVTVESDVEVTATFTYPPGQRAVNLLKAGTGTGVVTSSPAGISCGDQCSVLFDQDSQVTLTASPAAGSTFEGWSGAGCSGTGTCQITVDSDEEVTATFGGGVGAPPINIGGRTGRRAAAMRNCKKKRKHAVRAKCKKKARKLPV
jgi:Divergent InlB B-repeat domain